LLNPSYAAKIAQSTDSIVSSIFTFLFWASGGTGGSFLNDFECRAGAVAVAP
jgi:hypothetical protein